MNFKFKKFYYDLINFFEEKGENLNGLDFIVDFTTETISVTKDGFTIKVNENSFDLFKGMWD